MIDKRLFRPQPRCLFLAISLCCLVVAGCGGSGTPATSAPSTPTAATPTLNPGTGTYNSAQTVTISDSTAGAAVYYTLDGSTPSAASTKYSAAFTVSTTTTVNAIALASG